MAQLWQCHSQQAKHDGCMHQTQRKVLCCNTGKWKCSVNLPFTKLNQWEQCMRHHFPKMKSAADANWQIQLQSVVGLGKACVQNFIHK